MSILVIAEAVGDGFWPSTFELLAQARRWAVRLQLFW